MTRGGMLLLALALVGSGCADSRPGPPAHGPPRRICSLTLATDEILAELVPTERVVGVTRFVDDPLVSNAAGHYPPRVPRMAADLERIVALEPDLVCVADYNLAAFLEILARSGLPVFRTRSCRSFTEVQDLIGALARRVGVTRRGREIVEAMGRRLEALERRMEGIGRRPRVLYWARNWTSGKDTTIGELIERAGAINVAAEMGLRGSCSISYERVLAADPDVLLLEAEGQHGEPELPRILGSLRAVREGHIIALPPRCVSTVSQHLVEGAERLARQLHAGRFEPEGRTR